jgi:hypothetical protein
MEGVIYLLDTDALIVMIRGLKPGRPSAKRRVAERLVERRAPCNSVTP